MLRRRTGTILFLILASALLPSLVGVAFVLCLAPHASMPIVWLSASAAVAICYLLDEYGWLFVALTVIFATLGHGLYAMHLLGVSFHAIALIAALLVGLVFVMLARAVIAAGSADYPYDS
jgi:hypothetical protein